MARSLPKNTHSLSDDLSWMNKASCKGLTHIFYGKYAERPQATLKREAKAKAICNTCPVFQQCREYAREHMELGYWAGENEYDRYLSLPSERVPSAHSRALRTYTRRLRHMRATQHQEDSETYQDSSE